MDQTKYHDNRCRSDLTITSWIDKWRLCDIPSAEFSPGRVKTFLIFLYGERCQGKKEDGSLCGWARTNPKTGKIPLELDHVNGDSTDSRPGNVRLLCPSCHALTPTYRVLNAGRGRGNKAREQSKVNYLINEVARLTGRMPLIENERFVLVKEALPGSSAQEPPVLHALRLQRFSPK
jgi:hypothetical protein